MTVQVQLFARVRDLAGDELSFVLPRGATVTDLRRRLAETLSVAEDLLGRCAVAVNQEIVAGDACIPPGAEVALLPPVSGGQN
jgi:molybdopterin converting factor subunit 1